MHAHTGSRQERQGSVGNQSERVPYLGQQGRWVQVGFPEQLVPTACCAPAVDKHVRQEGFGKALSQPSHSVHMLPLQLRT